MVGRKIVLLAFGKRMWNSVSFASPNVDESEGDPVSGDETGNREDRVPDGDVVQVPVDLETDGGQESAQLALGTSTLVVTTLLSGPVSIPFQ